MAGYNPKRKKREYSLVNELEGKNQQDVIWMTPKILRMLALGRINIEKEGYQFLDPKFLDTVMLETYEITIKNYWQGVAFDALLAEVSRGSFSLNDHEYQKVVGLANKVKSTFRAYQVAYNGLLKLKNSPSLGNIVSMGQEMRNYSNHY